MSSVIHTLQSNEASSLPPTKEPAFSRHRNSSAVGSSSQTSASFSNNVVTISMPEGLTAYKRTILGPKIATLLNEPNNLLENATFLVLSFNVELDDHTDDVYFTYGVSDSSVKLRSVLNPNGLFVLLLWQDDSKTWSELGDWTGECVREKALTCGRNREGFSKVEFLKLPDHAVVLENKKSRSECESECLHNCSCKAYACANVEQGSPMRCITWYGNLVDSVQSQTLPFRVCEDGSNDFQGMSINFVSFFIIKQAKAVLLARKLP
ncbi:hypothetical protein ACE6H2_011845 [Prunus campanulata]